MNNKYKCHEHQLDIGCINCIKATYEKYWKLLDFVKNVSCALNDFNYDAEELLKEIGE
jgi:predicted transcriptional regulator with HTH domain